MRALLSLAVLAVCGCARVWGFDDPVLDAAPPAVVREPCFENDKIETKACDGGSSHRVCTPDGWSSWSACAQPGFRALPPAPIEGRIFYSAVWTGDEFIVWGGRTPDEAKADGAAYDPVKNTWRVLAPAPLTGRVDHAAVWTGKQMIVWGGRVDGSTTTTYFADGAAYDPRTNTWERLPVSPMPERARVAAVWSTTTREMVIWGGEYEFNLSSNDGAAYDPEAKKWTYLSLTSATPRAAFSSYWDGSRLVIVGGDCRGSMKGACNDVWSLDPDANDWTLLGPMPSSYPADGSYAYASLGTRMALFGGDALGKHLANGVLFDSKTKAFTAIDAPAAMELGAVTEREFATAWWAEGKLWIYGGAIGTAGFDDHCATWDPGTRAWSAVPDLGLGKRMGTTATRSHDDVFLFGGRRETATGAPPYFEHLNDGVIQRLSE